jgi:hypothetical protein
MLYNQKEGFSNFYTRFVMLYLLGKIVFSNPFLTVFENERKHLVVKTTNSIGVLPHVIDRDVVVMANQERDSMCTAENPKGLLEEIPAGRFDYTVSLKDLIVAEIKEEIGATITPADIVLINGGQPLALSPGVLTEEMVLAYVPMMSSQLEDEDRIFGEGGNEAIRRKFIPIASLPNYQVRCMKTFAAVQWFLNYLRSQGRSL